MTRPRLLATTPLLVVSDLARSLAFYCDKLGFGGANTWGNPPCFAMINRDGFELMLSLAERPEQVSPHGKHGVWDVFLSVADVTAETQALAAAGVPLQRGPERTFYDMLEIEVVDPDGHRICLAEDVSTAAANDSR